MEGNIWINDRHGTSPVANSNERKRLLKFLQRPTLDGCSWQSFDAVPVQFQVNIVFIGAINLRNWDGYIPAAKDMPIAQHQVGDVHGFRVNQQFVYLTYVTIGSLHPGTAFYGYFTLRDILVLHRKIGLFFFRYIARSGNNVWHSQIVIIQALVVWYLRTNIFLIFKPLHLFQLALGALQLDQVGSSLVHLVYRYNKFVKRRQVAFYDHMGYLLVNRVDDDVG